MSICLSCPNIQRTHLSRPHGLSKWPVYLLLVDTCNVQLIFKAFGVTMESSNKCEHLNILTSPHFGSIFIFISDSQHSCIDFSVRGKKSVNVNEAKNSPCKKSHQVNFLVTWYFDPAFWFSISFKGSLIPRLDRALWAQSLSACERSRTQGGNERTCGFSDVKNSCKWQRVFTVEPVPLWRWLQKAKKKCIYSNCNASIFNTIFFQQCAIQFPGLIIFGNLFWVSFVFPTVNNQEPQLPTLKSIPL